jgi:hypothetical protein
MRRVTLKVELFNKKKPQKICRESASDFQLFDLLLLCFAWMMYALATLIAAAVQ